MLQVQVPEGAAPGTTIQVQVPSGGTLHVQVPPGISPGQTLHVLDTEAQKGPGAPQQMVMGGANHDMFRGAQSTLIKQEWAAIEACGVEAKNRYRLSTPGPSGSEGETFLYIDEESDCCERICCGPARELTLRVHAGASQGAPIIQSMTKPMSCCLPPNSDVFAHGVGPTPQTLGHIDQPCRCCWVQQEVFDETKQLLFTTEGATCQLGMLCQCCADANFRVQKAGVEVARVSRLALNCEEMCDSTNRLRVDFGQITDPRERRLLLASAMLLELTYFEKPK